ncbi:MAG: hydrogenase maturation peptidase HycI [Candidatus Bathyarchaeia archaeon]
MTLENTLKKWLKGYRKLAILGVGNPMRGDDALGIEILKLLKNKVPKNVKLMNCETMPENFTGKIRRFKPSHVLLIDAAHFGAKTGEAKLFMPKEISGLVLSTHAMPISLLAETIQKSVGASVMLLGIQPKTVNFGEKLSPETQKAIEETAKIIVEILKENSFQFAN